ncbi:MAG: hypothetical protein K2N74_05600 [Clostridiales bacterium]|nr:hypothetical protein [Clostridiales bacterium]
MEKKTCDNCKYYTQRYIKKLTCFLNVGGHCTNPELRDALAKKKLPWRGDGECDRWESVEIVKAERRKEISETLRDMEKHLKEIALILKDDE